MKTSLVKMHAKPATILKMNSFTVAWFLELSIFETIFCRNTRSAAF